MIGDCGIANYLLNRDSKVGIDQFGVAFTFGIGGMLGIIVSGPISGMVVKCNHLSTTLFTLRSAY